MSPHRIGVVIVAALILSGCSHAATPLPPTPTRTASPTPSGEADPARDLGAGKPGAYCATNRLGKHFTKDGVTYVCKGPKPYRWREAQP